MARKPLQVTAQAILEDDCPTWLSHFEFTRENEEIIIDLVKSNGLSYARSRLCLAEFNKLADLLLDP